MGASARDYGCLDDGPEVAPGSRLGWGGYREPKLHSISANTETLRLLTIVVTNSSNQLASRRFAKS